MVKTSTGAKAAAAAPSTPSADPNAGAPLADPMSFFAQPEQRGDAGGDKAKALEAFDAALDRAGFGKKNGHEPQGEAEEEPEQAHDDERGDEDEEDPRVERARKFLKRHGYDEELLAGKDAAWLLDKRARLIERQSNQDSLMSEMRREISELRRTRSGGQDDKTSEAGARQTPSKPSIDFSSMTASVSQQWGPEAAKAFSDMGSAILKAATSSTADVERRLADMEQRAARREEQETRRAVAASIDAIAEQFPDLEDDPSARAEVEEAMTYLAPKFQGLAKTKGSEAALRELAVAAARSIGLEQEELEDDEKDEKPTPKKRGANRPVVSDRKPSPKPLSGNAAFRRVFDYVIDHRDRDSNVIANALKSVGRNRRAPMI